MNPSAFSRLTRILLATLSGIALGLAYPPTGLWGGMLAFVALVPLLIALEGAEGLGLTFRITFVAMFFLGLVSNYWVGGWASTGDADVFLRYAGIVLALVHPFFLAVPFLLYDVTRRQFGRTAALSALPVFYAGFEYAHSFGDLAYPWLNLYNTQTYNLSYVQFIEFTGPYFLSMVIVLVNIEIFQIFLQLAAKDKSTRAIARHGVALLALIALPYLYGNSAMHEQEPSRTSVRVTILQPNIDPWAKWNSDGQRILDSDFSATVTALRDAHDSTDLVLWPETAIPFFITTPSNAHELNQLHEFIRWMHHPLLTGFPDREEYIEGRDTIPSDANPSTVRGVYFRSWNAAMLAYQTPDGSIEHERYHKQKLVPLGEHVPFVEVIPFLGRFMQWGVGLGSWNYGTGYEPLALPLPARNDTLRIYPAICYESIYPSFVRNFVAHGANLLGVITNDGWYGFSSGPYQHEQFAVLRAIENRRWIVRSANTGISTVVDDRGRAIQSRPLFVSGSITQRVPLIERKTLYVRWGDYIAVPAMYCSVALFLYAVGLWIAKRRTRSSGKQT